MSNLKSDLNNLKDKLGNLEKDMSNQMDNLKDREELWKKLDNQAQNIRDYQNTVVRLNVSGQVFATRQDTLLAVKDSLFYKLVLSKKFDLTKEIFIDRSNNFFGIILDFLRNGKIDYNRFTADELEELKIEANYYELIDITQYLDERLKEPIIVNFEFKGAYIYSGTTAGTNKLEDVLDRNLNTGICCTTPGWIIFEFNHEFQINQLEIGGFRGNTNIWGPDNGAGSSILTSKDKTNWTNVGSIPTGYGTTITTVSLTKSVGKFIKLNHNSYLGVGFIKVIRI